MPLIVFSPYSSDTNYIEIVGAKIDVPYYDIGSFLHIRSIENTNSTDFDISFSPTTLNVYQENLNTNYTLSFNVTDADLQITNSTYSLSLVVNDVNTSFMNYSTFVSDDVLFVEDFAGTIFDIQYNAPTLLINNLSSSVTTNYSSFVSFDQ